MTDGAKAKKIRQSIEGDKNIQVAGDLVVVTLDEAHLRRLPSLLEQAIPILSGKVSNPNSSSTNTPLAFDIEDKIKHNNVIAYRHWIADYGQYGSIVDEVYAEIDRSNPGSEGKILRHIKAIYDRARAEQLKTHVEAGNPEASFIQTHADKLIASVHNSITDELNEGHTLAPDDIPFSAIVVVCHAFINCKILERPPHASR